MPEEKISPQEQNQIKKKKLKTWHKILIVIGAILLIFIIIFVYKIGLISRLLISSIGEVQITITAYDCPSLGCSGWQIWKIGEKGIFYKLDSFIGKNDFQNFLKSKNKIYYTKNEDFKQIILYLEQSKLFNDNIQRCERNSNNLIPVVYAITGIEVPKQCRGDSGVEVIYNSCQINENCFGEQGFEDVKMKNFINNFNNILGKYNIPRVGDYVWPD